MSANMEADAGRNWLVVAALILAAIAAIAYVGGTYWFDGGSEPLPSSVTVSGKGPGVESRESEHYQKVLTKYNHGNAEEAGATGSTYVSVFSTREQPVVTELPPQPKPPYVPPPAIDIPPPVQAGPAAEGEASLSESEQKRHELINQQVGALLANWAAVPHSGATVSDGYDEYAKSVGVIDEPMQEATTAERTAKPDAPVNKILPDYIRLAGLLETNIDTDETSVVVAFVPSGPYKGLKVYAPGYKRINSTVDLTFDAMVWKGKTYKVAAKAVDKDTLRTSLSGEVNNRYFERIILPSIAAGIGKTGQLYEQSNAQNIITPEGGVIQTYPSTPDPTAVLGSMIGGAGEQAGKVLAAAAAEIPAKQVLIPSMSTIGIQFIGPVLSSDELAPEAGSQAGY